MIQFSEAAASERRGRSMASEFHTVGIMSPDQALHFTTCQHAAQTGLLPVTTSTWRGTLGLPALICLATRQSLVIRFHCDQWCMETSVMLELSLVPNRLKVVFVLQTVGQVGLLRAQADFCCHQRLHVDFYIILIWLQQFWFSEGNVCLFSARESYFPLFGLYFLI